MTLLPSPPRCSPYSCQFAVVPLYRQYVWRLPYTVGVISEFRKFQFSTSRRQSTSQSIFCLTTALHISWATTLSFSAAVHAYRHNMASTILHCHTAIPAWHSAAWRHCDCQAEMPTCTQIADSQTSCLQWRDRPADAQLALTVWEVTVGKVGRSPKGGGTCNLFSRKGRLKGAKHSIDLLAGKGAEACATPGKTPLAERGEPG